MVSEHPERIAGQPVNFATPGLWPSLKDPRLRILLRHWAANRQGLMMPRSALDPAALKICLPNAWLYRFLPAEDDFICTVSGEKVNSAWGCSLMGKRIDEIMPGNMIAFATLAYRLILEMPAIQTSTRRIEPPDGIEQISERLIVPLANDAGGPYGVLGVTLYSLGELPQLSRSDDVRDEATFYPCAGLPSTLP